MNYLVYVFSETNKKFFKNNLKINQLEAINELNNFDFAIVANKTSDHLNILKKLLKHKIHIYCEKPIFFKKFNYRKIKNKIKKNKIVFHNGYHLRNDTKIEFIKKKLAKQKIKSFQVSVGYDFTKWRVAPVHKKSYYSNTKKGGGVIFELIHEINLINMLFGKIKKINTLKSKSKKFNCEDVAVSIIETEKEIVGTLYQDMYSNTLFRFIKIVTESDLFEIDLVKNLIIKNNKIKIFQDNNKQYDLLKKNILIFKKKINLKNYSLDDYDIAINDLNICLKMHHGK